MLTLYQFPISHYCEKVRWSLAYKELAYQTKNLLPGLHASTARKMTGKSSLPILVHESKVFTESSAIITYLDERFPEKSLTPSDPDLKQQALDWERYADEKMGPHVRRICYDVLLDHPDMVIRFFTEQGPWYGKFLLKAIFPKVRKRMRQLMKIDADATLQSKQILDVSLNKVFSHCDDGKRFLVGDEFTRADLAVASLLAPLCMPEKYGLTWPERYPDALDEFVKGYSNKLEWVKQLYEDYR